MGACYIMAGILTGIAATAIGMGGDGRVGLLFLPSFAFTIVAAILEHKRKY